MQKKKKMKIGLVATGGKTFKGKPLQNFGARFRDPFVGITGIT